MRTRATPVKITVMLSYLPSRKKTVRPPHGTRLARQAKRSAPSRVKSGRVPVSSAGNVA